MSCFRNVSVFFFFSFITLSVYDINAQFRRAALLKPVFMLAYENVPSQSIVDTAGKFGLDAALVSVKIPLITRMNKGTRAGSFGFWGIILNGGGSYSWPDFSYLSSVQHLVQAHAGINGIYYGGKRSVFLLGAKVLAGEDSYSISSPRLRYAGSLVLVHKFSTVFSLIAGGAYSYAFGNGMPLPVLGANVNFNKRSSINFTLPFNASFGYWVGKRNKLAVFARPSGGFNNISSRNRFPGYPEVIQLRQRLFQIGASVSIYLGNGFRVIPEAGYNTKRTLTFSEQGSARNDYLIKVQSGGGPYVRLAISLRLGEKPYHGENDAVNYLMLNGIDQTPSDPDEKLIFR